MHKIVFKKQKTCTVFLPSYRNMSGSKFGRTRNAVGTRSAGEVNVCPPG